MPQRTRSLRAATIVLPNPLIFPMAVDLAPKGQRPSGMVPRWPIIMDRDRADTVWNGVPMTHHLVRAAANTKKWALAGLIGCLGLLLTGAGAEAGLRHANDPAQVVPLEKIA